MFRMLVFAAAILALAEVSVAGKRIGAHVTSGVGVLWKSGPGRWLSKSLESVPWSWGRKIVANLEPSAPPSAPGKRVGGDRTIREDIGARDRARLQALLEGRSP